LEYDGEVVGEESVGTTAKPTVRSPRYDREAFSDQSQTPARKGGDASYHVASRRPETWLICGQRRHQNSALAAW